MKVIRQARESMPDDRGQLKTMRLLHLLLHYNLLTDV